MWVFWEQKQLRIIVNQAGPRVYKGQKIIKTIEDKIISNTRKVSEQEEEEEDYYKLEKVDKFYSSSFIIYQSRDDKNKTLSIKEYLIKIRPYLKDIINDLKRKYYTWKIKLTIAINFVILR